MVIKMTNVVVLIGVIEKAYYDEGTQNCYVDLKLEKTIKNENGLIEFEIYKVKLWRGIYNDLTSIKPLQKNVILGVKGRLEKNENEVMIVAEKVSFLGKTMS